MVMLCNIRIKLDYPDGKPLGEASDTELIKAITTEINAFETWFKAQSNAPLVGVERSLLRTFLAWKLKYEEVDVDTED